MDKNFHKKWLTAMCSSATHKADMRIKRFGKVLPVRLTEDVDRKLKRFARAAGITKSDALRLAINHGLPDLEAGRISTEMAR